MTRGKRRNKGKQSSGRSTPITPPSQGSKVDDDSSDEDNAKDTNKKQVGSKVQEDGTTQNAKGAEKSEESDLVLTSEKRRGVYECDYCHNDISQLPRIRCAICPDFDLCLDCFATTDHESAVAKFKAAASAHSELKADGIASTLVAGISSAAANHDPVAHGYRVCDSTRFPIFGSARSVVKASKLSAMSDKDNASEIASTRDDDEEDDDKMEVDDDDDKKSLDDTGAPDEAGVAIPDVMVVSEDPKAIWTAEEDLRLLDAIKTHGLGNWGDISDAVGGNGSVGKTPKRCMERYFDDFLGRYGHILPPYTIVGDYDEEGEANEDLIEDEAVRVSKRRQALMMRTPSNLSASSTGGRARKRYKVVPTETLPGYDEVWPNAYLPDIEGIKVGQEVARDLSTKHELAFVKATAAAATQEEAEKIREEWMATKMNQIGSPTVLPPRPEDTEHLPGAELVGFMPRRGDFDIEWENEAETALADMEFTQGDSEQEKQLKLQVLEIYCQKQDEREKRKKFILSRQLYDYRKYAKEEEKLPQDERNLMHRMRLFERFHTPDEHKQFIADIIKAKRLRKEIAKLQMYRRIGIRSLAEAEMYELDKSRRQFHKAAQMQKEAEAKQAKAGTSSSPAPETTVAASTPQGLEAVDSLWKQYRTSDRKVRRSINRSTSGISEEPAADKESEQSKGADGKDEKKGEGEKDNESKAVKFDKDPVATHKGIDGRTQKDKMDVDGNVSVNTTRQFSLDANKPIEGYGNLGKEVKFESTEVDPESFDISEAKGYDLLSRREASLCVRLKLYPAQYLEMKKALINEALSNGLLDKDGPGTGRRTVVKIDVERRGDVIDFMLRAGWISKRLAKAAQSLGPATAA